jgi:DNA-binding NarL/FixJ family response regulator
LNEIQTHARVILVVEDDPMTRVLLADMLESAGFIAVMAATAAQAQRLFAARDPDAAILDVDLGHGLNGFDLADAFHRRSPAIALLFLTHLPDSRFVSRASNSLPEGAAYLRKDQLFDKRILLEALEAVLSGEVTSEHRHDWRTDRPNDVLSRTQIEVMSLVAQGRSSSDIAQARGTNVRTVQYVITRSLERMGIDPQLEVTERRQAVATFLRDAGSSRAEA